MIVVDNQILIKPPDTFTSSREIDNNNWKNCTFSTVEQLKDLIKNKHFNRESIMIRKEDERDQVERLNHWRNNSSAQGARNHSKKYTFRRKLSVTYDTSTIISITNSEFQKHQDSFAEKHVSSIISSERNRNKLLKTEKNRITEKNKNLIQHTSNELSILSEEVKKIELQIRKLKDEIEALSTEVINVDAKHDVALRAIQQQEFSLQLITKNVQLKKMFKLGESNEYYLFREKLRHEKQSLHSEYTEGKEKLENLLAEKQKEKEHQKEATLGIFYVH